nr:uncharacterized protein C9orf50 homolog [Dasypus novemcinctus]
MSRRHPNAGAQEVAPEWFPGDGGLRRRRASRLPALIPPALGEVLWPRGARGSAGSRVPGGGASWWQALRPGSSDPLAHRVTEPGGRVGSAAAQRATRSRAGLRSLLLPPLLSAGASRRLSAPRSFEDWRDPQRASHREPSCSRGALLGGFLSGKFREFLCQLGAELEEPPPPPPQSSTSQHRGGVAENLRGSSQCLDCSFLPDLSLKKILLHQTPVVGPLRGDRSQFSTIGKAHQPCSPQAPALKAVLTPSSSGEGSLPRRRCCPFRVRFADETLRDTALRYWERNCAVQQCLLKDRAASQSAVAEQVVGGVGRWLESLPRVLRPRAKKEKAAASDLRSWDCPSPPTQKLQGRLSENGSGNSSLPFIPRATTQGQRGDLQTSLDAHSVLEQEGKSPRSWSQKLESFLPKLVLQSVLKRGHSKGIQLRLPSTTPQRAQR